MKRIVASAYFLPMAAMSVAHQAPSPPSVITSAYPFSNPYGLSNNGRTLEVAVGTETNYGVDVSGLQVNLACANKISNLNLKTARIALLDKGCASITGTPLNSAESRAQAKAKAQKVGLWTPGAKPTGTNPTGTKPAGNGGLIHWLLSHKLISFSSAGVFLAALNSPWLLRFFGWLLGFLHKRKVKIIIAGATSAGKTGLWTRWRDQYDHNPSPTMSVNRSKLNPVELRKWTLEPVAFDTAGSQPQDVLQGIIRPRGLQGKLWQARTKHVLVYVVSPTPTPTAAAGKQFDQVFIAKQEGYTHLPLALISNGDPRFKLDLVVMFATKYDLLDNVPPKDSGGTAPAEMSKAFGPHRELLSSACKRANVPFTWLIGSAERDWSIDQLTRSLAQVIQ